MACPANTTSAWSIRYLHIHLLYFVYVCTYFAEARPTGSKLPCEDGCKHMHLMLGVDNHLVPRWTFSRVRDASEKAVLAENHPVPNKPRVNSEHQVLALDVSNHLVPIRSAIHYGGEAHSPNTGKGVRDENSQVPLVYSILDIDSHLVRQRTVIHRDGAGGRDKNQVFILDKDSHVVPLRRMVYFDEPESKVYPQTPASSVRNHMVPLAGLTRRTEADRFLALNSFNHLVPVRQPVNCCDKANMVYLPNTESHLAPRRQVIRGDENYGAFFLDANNHLVPLGNEVRGEIDLFHTGNQPALLRSIIRRAEPDDGAPTAAAGQIEPDMQQGSHKKISIGLCLIY